MNLLTPCPTVRAPFTESDIRQAVTRRSLTLELPLEPGEDIYGLGLQLKSFRQTAKKKLLRPNSDPASDTGDSHAPVPFYVSTKGYGILVDTARYAAFHCGNCKQVDGPQDKAGFMSGGTAVGHWEIKDGSGNMLIDIPAAEGVDLYIFAGENLRDAVCRYNLFSGGGALPPLWGLGVLYRADWARRPTGAAGAGAADPGGRRALRHLRSGAGLADSCLFQHLRLGPFPFPGPRGFFAGIEKNGL